MSKKNTDRRYHEEFLKKENYKQMKNEEKDRKK